MIAGHVTSCVDWEERLIAGRPIIPAPIFQEEAEQALQVFRSLRVPDLPGKPTFGESSPQWMLDLVGCIFGSYDSVDAKRYIEQVFLLVSKKNGKSTLAAAIMLTALIRNWRHHAELLILAPTIEIARNSFEPAAAMIRADPILNDLMHVIDHQRIIRHRVTNSELKIVAADKDTVSGKKAGFVLIEELWLFGKRHDATAMLREATGGLASRPEGFVIYISTHSDEPPAGIFRTKLEYFRDVRDGRIDDPTSLPVLYEWPAKMLEDRSYLKPENFHITNPSLGYSIHREWIARQLEREQASDGENLQIFLSKHLNVEVGLRLRRDRWSGAENWASAAREGMTLDDILDSSEVVVVGIDGGGLDDLLGMCVLGREKETRRWLAWTRAWAHRQVLERRKDIAPALLDFERDGDVVICDDPTQDIVEVADIVEGIVKRGLVPDEAGIGFDPMGVGAMVDEITSREVPESMIVGVPQGFRLSTAVWGIERKLADRTLVHCGQRMMDWCVSNARVEQRGNAVVISKSVAGRAKIDPLVALLNAAMLMSRNPASKTRSVYETRGVLAL